MMKKLFVLILAILSMASCNTKNTVENKSAETASIKPEKNEDGEWDLDVIDDRYDYFLAAVGKPMSMYSESYLKSKNSMLVSEWNSLYYSGRSAISLNLLSTMILGKIMG